MPSPWLAFWRPRKRTESHADEGYDIVNVFSEDYFFDAYCKVYSPGKRAVARLFDLGGRLWRLPTIDEQVPIRDLEVADFFEPFDPLDAIERGLAAPLGDRRGCKLRYLPRVSQRIVSRDEWIREDLGQIFQAAPTTRWSEFDTWEAFTKYVRQAESTRFSDLRRRIRNLEKEVGPVQFHFSDRRTDPLEILIQWKREQLRHHRDASGLLVSPKRVSLLKELAARHQLLVSTLSSDDRFLAIAISMIGRGRFYFWNTAYNASYTRYAPGVALLHFMLEESYRHQHHEFDFLWGDEAYKWMYATHVRLIEDVGSPPFYRQIKARMKSGLRSVRGGK